MDNPQMISSPNILLIAIVQSQDSETTEGTLEKIGLTVTRLPSQGAFLGRRNATILVGVPENQLEECKEQLKDNCRQRLEYLTLPLENVPMPMPAPIPVTVGGATVFGLHIDHFEEI